MTKLTRIVPAATAATRVNAMAQLTQVVPAATDAIWIHTHAMAQMALPAHAPPCFACRGPHAPSPHASCPTPIHETPPPAAAAAAGGGSAPAEPSARAAPPAPCPRPWQQGGGWPAGRGRRFR